MRSLEDLGYGFVSRLLFLGAALFATACGSTPVRNTLIEYPEMRRYSRSAEDCVLELERNRTYTVRIGHAGYEDEFVHLSPRFSNWLNGNALVGGLIGISHDVGSGGAMKLVPGEIDIVMRRSPLVASDGEASP